ncbi:MAG: carboxypeptidase-like regulatory domain-containing protein, partial [Planctomycetota bacterium]
ARVILQSSLDWDVLIPPDAELIASMQDWFTRREVVTDAEGWYAFEDPPSGSFEVAARTSLHAPGGLEDQSLPKNESTEFPVIRLNPGAILQGTVVGPDGLGVPGAMLFRSLGSDVRSGWAKMPGRGIPLGETNADGTFRLSNLDAEDFTLLADAHGFIPGELRVSSVEPGRTPRVFRVHLLRGLEITGRVVDFPEDRAESLLVTARPAPTQQEKQLRDPAKDMDPAAHRPRTAAVAKDGSFRLTGMDKGRRYRLTAYEPNRNAKIVPGRVNRPRRARELEASYAYAGETDVEIKLHIPATLRFRVIDANTKEPLTAFAAGAGFGGSNWLKRQGEVVQVHEGGLVEFDNLRRYDEEDEPKIVDPRRPSLRRQTGPAVAVESKPAPPPPPPPPL